MTKRDYKTDMDRSELLRGQMSELRKKIDELNEMDPYSKTLQGVQEQIKDVDKRLREFYRVTYAFGRTSPGEQVMDDKTLQEWEDWIEELEFTAHDLMLKKVKHSFESSRQISFFEREYAKMNEERNGIRFYYHWGDGRSQRKQYWEEKSKSKQES